MYSTLTGLGAHPDAITTMAKREEIIIAKDEKNGKGMKNEKEEGEGKWVWGWVSDFWWNKPKDTKKEMGRET
jgi:hypothetical protein